MSNICIIAFTSNGVKLAESLKIGDIYAYYKYNRNHKSFKKISDIMQDCWNNYHTIIFISACGIAVRAIAPFVKDKTKDPAVVVCDELGKFAISLLSGHIGGANDIARKLATLTMGIPVITTATDILGRFAVDVWAKENNLVLKDLKLAKKISSAIVNGDEVGYVGCIKKPVGLVENSNASMGVFVGHTMDKPFKNTLRLATKSLILGIGCKSNTPYEDIKTAVDELFEKENLNLDSVKMISSVSIKANESGIIRLASELGVNFATYSVYYLGNIAGQFSYSEFVKNEIGLDCVCERAALAKGGKLIVKKHKFPGVTLAVAKV